MTTPLKHPVAPARIDAVKAFELRCWARAELWAACAWDGCHYPLAEAVDPLQRAAERDGLVETIGQDAVQRILADAFHRNDRAHVDHIERNSAFSDHASWAAAAGEYHKERGSRVSLASYTPAKLERLRALLDDGVSLDRAWAALCKPSPGPTATLRAAEFPLTAKRPRSDAALAQPA
jgi:hypothetical protein